MLVHLRRDREPMSNGIPREAKAALDVEIAADTDDAAGQAYRDGQLDSAE